MIILYFVMYNIFDISTTIQQYNNNCFTNVEQKGKVFIHVTV